MRENYSDQFEQFFNLTRKFSRLIGVDVLSEDYKYNWRTYLLYFLTNIGVGFTIYTIAVDMFNGLWTSVLVSLSIIGLGIQGYVKLVISTKKRNIQLLRFMFHTICDIYTDYEKKSLDYKNELKLCLSRLKKVILALFLLAVIVASLTVGVPLFMWVFQGKRTFMLNFFMPYIDVETDFGYYFTFVVHALCVFFAGFGNLLCDIWYFIFVAHVPLISNILKCKFHDLDKILEEHPRDTKKSKQLLIDILKWHQKYNDFCAALNENYYWVIFVQITNEFVSIICGIVCIFLNLWPAASAAVIYFLTVFYCFCAVGNIVEVANADVILHIYHSNWYLLTVKEQKMILYMLRNAQRAKGILIGDVTPLSLNTALQMTKTFYTISMVLREFLNK